jgi:hypothetical protein
MRRERRQMHDVADQQQVALGGRAHQQLAFELYKLWLQAWRGAKR